MCTHMHFFFSGYGKITLNFYRTTTSLSIPILGEIFCWLFDPNYLKFFRWMFMYGTPMFLSSFGLCPMFFKCYGLCQNWSYKFTCFTNKCMHVIMTMLMYLQDEWLCRFMWQICGYIPTTLPKDPDTQVSLKAAQLSTSFVLETLIHSKEKVTKLFSLSQVEIYYLVHSAL